MLAGVASPKLRERISVESVDLVSALLIVVSVPLMLLVIWWTGIAWSAVLSPQSRVLKVLAVIAILLLAAWALLYPFAPIGGPGPWNLLLWLSGWANVVEAVLRKRAERLQPLAQ
jgi:hypothetical protein